MIAERVKMSKFAKFESYMLETGKDVYLRGARLWKGLLNQNFTSLQLN